MIRLDYSWVFPSLLQNNDSLMSQNQESRTAECHARGDDLAIEDFEQFLRDYVRSRLPAGLRRHAGTSDVVQSVLCAATREFSTFRGSTKTQFRGWLLRIAHHKMVDKLRKYRRRRCTSKALNPYTLAFSDWIDHRTPDTQLTVAEEAQLLLDAIETLPRELRRIVVLRHQQCMTFEAVAEELSMSVTTCRRRWLEALEILRCDLEGLLS
jgi:RNA polymerase sigma factor (sigma-70 family)